MNTIMTSVVFIKIICVLIVIAALLLVKKFLFPKK